MLGGRALLRHMQSFTGREIEQHGGETSFDLEHALYYWKTNHGAEVDLLIELDGSLHRAIEFKSTATIGRGDLTGLSSFHEDNPEVECFIVCLAPEPFSLDFVHVVPWRDYLADFPR